MPFWPTSSCTPTSKTERQDMEVCCHADSWLCCLIATPYMSYIYNIPCINYSLIYNHFCMIAAKMENPGIDPGASHMLSERSTI